MGMEIYQEVYPDLILQLGDINNYVLALKISLNDIAVNYPAIPAILPVNSVFDESMEAAVREFQNIFHLPITGVIDKATWYEIGIIHTSVVRLAGLSAQGILMSDVTGDIAFLDEGIVVPRVQLVQYFLNVLSAYYDSIPPVDIDGILGPYTGRSIIEFQKTMNLDLTGIIDEETWIAMYASVLGIFRELPPTAIELPSLLYPNVIFSKGSEGPGVLVIQEILSYISTVILDIPPVTIDGSFGPETEAAVMAFQRIYGIEADGVVDEGTWNMLVNVYREFRFDLGARGFPGSKTTYARVKGR